MAVENPETMTTTDVIITDIKAATKATINPMMMEDQDINRQKDQDPNQVVVEVMIDPELTEDINQTTITTMEDQDINHQKDQVQNQEEVEIETIIINQVEVEEEKVEEEDIERRVIHLILLILICRKVEQEQ